MRSLVVEDDLTNQILLRAFLSKYGECKVAANGSGKRSAADVLAQGPASFLELMEAAGSRDGREIVRELDGLYANDKLTRNEAGRYMLKGK